MIKNKNAFAMIIAIMVIVLIGGILALSISMTAETTKRNEELYLHEQAEILSNSARQYAMYKIGHSACSLTDTNISNQDNFYNIEIKVGYVSKNGCPAGFVTDINITDSNITNETAILDIVVSIDKNKTKTSEDIRYYKRYIENIRP